jgi:hypothetical protein
VVRPSASDDNGTVRGGFCERRQISREARSGERSGQGIHEPDQGGVMAIAAVCAEVVQPRTRRQGLQRLTDQVRPACGPGDACGLGGEMLSACPGAGPTVTQRHLGLNDRDFRADRRIGGPAS